MPSPTQPRTQRLIPTCFDCGIGSRTALCSSCVSHRQDGHEPRQAITNIPQCKCKHSLESHYGEGGHCARRVAGSGYAMCQCTGYDEGVADLAYCHGAGPAGRTFARLAILTPHVVMVDANAYSKAVTGEDGDE